MALDEQPALGLVSAVLRPFRTSVSGYPVNVYQEGEVCVSGPNVMQGYNNLPDASAEVFFDYDGKRYGTVRVRIRIRCGMKTTSDAAPTKYCPESRQLSGGSPVGHGMYTAVFW